MMKKNYRIFKEFGKNNIATKDILRIDLFDNFKLKDVPELKDFSFIYSQAGYNANNKKVRYIQVFRK